MEKDMIQIQLSSEVAKKILHKFNQVVDISNRSHPNGKLNINRYNLAEDFYIIHTRNIDDGRIHEFYLHVDMNNFHRVWKRKNIEIEVAIPVLEHTLHISRIDAHNIFRQIQKFELWKKEI